MNGKERLMLMISQCDYKRSRYFSELFKYVPNIVAEEIRYFEVQKDESIITAGKQSEYVYMVLSGDVRGVDYNKTGDGYSFMDFTDMYIIGDFEVITNAPEYMNTIFASKDCKLLRIPSAHYLNWIKKDENALFLRLSNTLSIMMSERKQDRMFLYKGCKKKVISYFIRYYKKHKSPMSEVVTLGITQAGLAEKVGSSLRSVQRAVLSLKNDKLITVENRKISISYQQYLMLVEEDEKERG